MRILPVPLTFHGKPILIEFHWTVRDPRIVLATIRGLLLRMEEVGASEDVLVYRIHHLVAAYDRLSADLVSLTPEAIAFAVSRRGPGGPMASDATRVP